MAVGIDVFADWAFVLCVVAEGRTLESDDPRDAVAPAVVEALAIDETKPDDGIEDDDV